MMNILSVPNGEIPIPADILPPNPIRVVTPFSRYPVHRLAKQGNIIIEINERDAHGQLSIKWEVSHNSKYGQPGPLAYKIDTLIINRRIEETARPIPKIIRLGSLRDIIAELGISSHNTNKIKEALYQNAFAAITPKIRYRQNDGKIQTLETGFTRYTVVFTGEELPDGRKADAVYIVLNDVYMQVINGAMTRPLDYDYLKHLNPAPQRFYELLSFQVYAAIKNDRARAKLLYSEFCTYAPQTRYLSFEQAKKQMYKIHAEHRKSGYIARIDYEQTSDSNGHPDWIMLYQPGPKARAEFRAFTKRGGPQMLEAEPLRYDAAPAPVTLQQSPLPLAAPEPSPQEASLIGHGITPAKAAELARQHDAATIDTYIEYLEWEMKKKPGKIADPAAWLFSAFKDGRGKPKGFKSREERRRDDEAQQAKERQKAEQKRQEQQETARTQKHHREEDAYWNSLTGDEQERLDAEAMTAADATARDTYQSMRRMGSGDGYFRAYIRRPHIRRMLDAQADA